MEHFWTYITLMFGLCACIGFADQACDQEKRFLCESGECIRKSWVCDGEEDCDDGSDEKKGCERLECRPGEFMCTSKRCIPRTYVCDGSRDCPDGNDEANCDTINPDGPRACNTTTHFQCGSGECIKRARVCDAVNNCPDGSDELDGCTRLECDADHLMCRNNKCVLNIFACDREDDCGDGTDELNCPKRP